MRMKRKEQKIRVRHLKRMYRMQEKRAKQENKISGQFMNRVVVTLILAAFVFTVTMIIVFIRTGSEPSTLIERVFAFLSVEGGALALIKSVKTVTKSKKQHEDEPEESEEVSG